jgi:hypothetical protein
MLLAPAYKRERFFNGYRKRLRREIIKKRDRGREREKESHVLKGRVTSERGRTFTTCNICN